MTDTPIIPGAADFCLLSPRAHRAARRCRSGTVFCAA
jgi:hypothetical protein